jgi:hypothetical protein
MGERKMKGNESKFIACPRYKKLAQEAYFRLPLMQMEPKVPCVPGVLAAQFNR